MLRSRVPESLDVGSVVFAYSRELGELMHWEFGSLGGK